MKTAGKKSYFKKVYSNYIKASKLDVPEPIRINHIRDLLYQEE